METTKPLSTLNANMNMRRAVPTSPQILTPSCFHLALRILLYIHLTKGERMNIEGHEISQHTIESYLRACRYNQSVATDASDKIQREAHREMLRESGIKSHTDECIKFSMAINQLTDDLLRKGY